MLIPYLIILTAITAITFIVLFLSKFFFKKTHTAIKLAYLVIALAIGGIMQSLLYGVQVRHSLTVYPLIILAMIIVISRTKKKR
ncbi:Uncharacterised protein [Paenibacillus thiaminolyticus]|nr:Uncharacterised protein [Paenibacillus thiaminolyticus]